MQEKLIQCLKDENTSYKALFDHAADGLVVLNERREILYMNRACREMIGSDPEEGTFCGIVFHCYDDDQSCFDETRCYGSCVLSSGRSLEYVELNITTSKGNTIPVGVSYSYVPVGNNKYILMSIRNISDRKRADELFYTLRERERIARDLHDGVVQNIAYAGMQMKVLQSFLKKGDIGRADGKIGELISVLEGCYSELRQALFDLTFKVNEQLVNFLKTYTAEFQNRTEIDTTVHIEGVPEFVDPFVSNQVANVVQEALANVRKHAQATKVSVHLKYQPGLLELVVEDNGIGFRLEETVEKSDHYGLTSMRDRAALINGFVDVQSIHGKGTKVYMSVPYFEEKQIERG